MGGCSKGNPGLGFATGRQAHHPPAERKISKTRSPADFGSAQLNLYEISHQRNHRISPPRPIHPADSALISRQNGFLEGSRQARQGYPSPRPHRYGNIERFFRLYLSYDNVLMMADCRFSWWCHPGARRVHGRPDSFHHSQRQGPRYAPERSFTPSRPQRLISLRP